MVPPVRSMARVLSRFSMTNKVGIELRPGSSVHMRQPHPSTSYSDHLIAHPGGLIHHALNHRIQPRNIAAPSQYPNPQRFCHEVSPPRNSTIRHTSAPIIAAPAIRMDPIKKLACLAQCSWPEGLALRARIRWVLNCCTRANWLPPTMVISAPQPRAETLEARLDERVNAASPRFRPIMTIQPVGPVQLLSHRTGIGDPGCREVSLSCLFLEAFKTCFPAA